MTISADLWELPQPQLTSTLTDKTEENFYSRCPPEKRPRFMIKETQMSEDLSPTVISASTNKYTAGDENEEHESAMGKVCSEVSCKLANLILPNRRNGQNCRNIISFPTTLDGIKNRNAINRSSKLSSKPFLSRSGQPVSWSYCQASFNRKLPFSYLTDFFLDTLKTTTPLLNKLLLEWLTDSFAYFRLTDAEQAAHNLLEPQSLGYGVGLAFALFIMQGENASTFIHVAFFYSLCRGGQFGKWWPSFPFSKFQSKIYGRWRITIHKVRIPFLKIPPIITTVR